MSRPSSTRRAARTRAATRASCALRCATSRARASTRSSARGGAGARARTRACRAVIRAAKRCDCRSPSTSSRTGPDGRERRRRPRLPAQARHPRRLRLPLERLHRGGMAPVTRQPSGMRLFAQTNRSGFAAARRLRGLLHVRHPAVPARVRPAVRPGAPPWDPLRAVRRARLQARAATGDIRVSRAARRDVRLDVARAERAGADLSRSRATTSGTRGRRSSRRRAAGATRATTAPGVCSGRAADRAYITARATGRRFVR